MTFILSCYVLILFSSGLAALKKSGDNPVLKTVS